MSFTFEKDFSIKYCEQGGYVINQSNFVEGTHRYFERAFSNLTDLTNFLIQQKEYYLEPAVQPDPLARMGS